MKVDCRSILSCKVVEEIYKLLYQVWRIISYGAKDNNSYIDKIDEVVKKSIEI